MHGKSSQTLFALNHTSPQGQKQGSLTPDKELGKKWPHLSLSMTLAPTWLGFLISSGPVISNLQHLLSRDSAASS